MNSIKRFYLIIFLFYISGLPQRLGLVPQLVNEVLILFFAIPGIFFFSVYLVKFRYKAEMLDFYLLLFLIIYPVFSAIVAKITVGQPLYMGILSFRGLYIILAFYTIYCMNFNELAILSHVNTVNVFIILLVVFLFFILSINDFNTVFRKGTLAIKYGYTSTKGNQFSGYSGLFFISFIYGWVLYFEKHSIKYLILPAGILVCSVFITKARNEIFTICIIPFAMYYLKYKMFNIKFLTITIFLVLIFYITIATDNIVSRSFSGLLHPRDLEFAQTTKDYSAYLRVQEIKDGLKWFLKYPITGVGSISYRYNGGYMGFISNFFYISDIGLVGLLIKGGVILVALYTLFFRKLISYFSADDIISVTGRYMILFILIELIIGNDFFYNNSGAMVVLFLIRPSRNGIERSLYY